MQLGLEAEVLAAPHKISAGPLRMPLHVSLQAAGHGDRNLSEPIYFGLVFALPIGAILLEGHRVADLRQVQNLREHLEHMHRQTPWDPPGFANRTICKG